MVVQKRSRLRAKWSPIVTAKQDFRSQISMFISFAEFEGAAEELKGWGIPLIKVDGTKEKELADQVGVTIPDSWQPLPKNNYKLKCH